MVGRKLKLSYNYNMVKPSMLLPHFLPAAGRGDEEKQQAALWLVGEQPVVLSGTHDSRFISPINGNLFLFASEIFPAIPGNRNSDGNFAYRFINYSRPRSNNNIINNPKW